MKSILVLFTLSAFVVLASATTTFTTKYDNVDLDSILRNRRLTDNYVDCLLDKKKCSPDGKELKAAIKPALIEECAGCSEKQKAGAEKVLKFLYTNRRDVFDQLAKKYDPDNVFAKKYEKEISAAKKDLN